MPSKKIKKIKKQKTQPTHSDKILLPTVNIQLTQIYNQIKSINPLEEWKAIEEWLQTKYTTGAELKMLIQQQASISARAKNLYLLSNQERKLFELQYKDRMQIWRKLALQYWEQEKQDGMHKQITEKMLEDWIIENWNELYTELTRRHEELNNICASIDELVKQITNHGHNLRKLLDSEIRKPTLPNWLEGKKKEHKKSQ